MSQTFTTQLLFYLLCTYLATVLNHCMSIVSFIHRGGVRVKLRRLSHGASALAYYTIGEGGSPLSNPEVVAAAAAAAAAVEDPPSLLIVL